MNEEIPQFQPWVNEQECLEVVSCLASNWITEGPRSEEFLRLVLERVGANYGVLAPNGTLGLYLALKAAGIGPGDEVIVPDFTFFGSASAVAMAGATPVLVDVEPVNLQLDVERLRNALTKRTKALMPVHIYGTAADMGPICDFAKKHGLLVIEDAAQAIGVTYNGAHVGHFGAAGVFSFFADKTITTGEGAVIVTDDEEIYWSLRYLRNQGREARGSFVHPHLGFNFRMTDLQCAVGVAQMRRLDEVIARKQRIYEQYKGLLEGISELRLLGAADKANLVPFRVCIEVERKGDVERALIAEGVRTRGFFYPLHLQEGLRGIAKEGSDGFPVAEAAYERGICLPCFAEMTSEQVMRVCTAVRAGLGYV